MKAEIIAIGSELVSGQCLDTNSQWLSRELGSLGIPVHFHTTLGDDMDEDVAAFQIAIAHADLILVSGGLGPTQDDLTREALARVAGVPLVENAEALAAIGAMFARRSRPMAERNRVQALFPLGAEVIPNRVGTAPGIWMKVGNAVVACLPGVPSELRVMYDEQVRPRLNQFGSGGRVILHHKINLFGRGESDVEAAALDLTARGRVPEVGITAHDATISFRISAEGTTEDEARRAMEPTLDLIRSRFVELIVGEGTDDVAEALLAQLVRTGATVATAESCTGAGRPDDHGSTWRQRLFPRRGRLVFQSGEAGTPRCPRLPGGGPWRGQRRGRRGDGHRGSRSVSRNPWPERDRRCRADRRHA